MYEQNKNILFKIPNTNNDFLKKKKNTDVKLSSAINQPMFSLGFHAFLHRVKKYMTITNNLESKKKFYYIVNNFEHEISDYDEDISHISKKYFKIKDDPNIISRAFYKLWEILIIFDLFNKKKDFSYAAIAEAPGSFLQAVIKFRETFNFDMSNDKIFSISIHPEKGNYLSMSKQFMGYYNKKYNSIINNHKTYTVNSSIKYKSRDNGDIKNMKSISLFKADLEKSKKYADLITADGGFGWDDENYQEQEAYTLIFGEILGALSIQAKNGNFVLKIFESFTMVTIKMIYLLSSFYEECYLYKPYFSRKSNSEKYIICKNFKYEPNSKELLELLSNMETILKKMDTKLFVNNIFLDLEIPDEFINTFKYININISNKQQIIINKIVTYIKDNNYFGDAYHSYRDEQIKATKWWVDYFFLEKLVDKKELVNNIIEYNNSEIKLFSNKFIMI